MPRIGRGNPTSSSEHSDNEAPSSSTPGVSSTAGRRERHGVLGFLSRSFRRSGSSTRTSGGPSASTSQQRQRQAPAPRVAAQTAAALGHRSPLLGRRGHGEEAFARAMQELAWSLPATPSSSPQDSPSRAHARGGPSPLAGSEPNTDHLVSLIYGADAARARLAMPERDEENYEDNATYAWRVLSLNRGASLDDIAAASILPDPGDLPNAIAQLSWTIDELNTMIATRDAICATFSGLRSISKTDAETLGFKDAKDYDADDASASLFSGEELSTSNRNQRVIALAGQPSEPSKDYSAVVNKGVAFMDLNELAHHLASNPKHPTLHDVPLNQENIADYAFRIE